MALGFVLTRAGLLPPLGRILPYRLGGALESVEQTHVDEATALRTGRGPGRWGADLHSATLKPDPQKLVAELNAISLAELDRRAALLKRVDNKYVLGEDALRRLLERVRSDHVVLEIDGRRAFGYESQYFDTPGLRCFLDHVEDRRPRFKARTRYYRATGHCVFEVKLKNAADETDKRQVDHPVGDRDRMTDEAERCLQEALADAGIELDEHLEPALRTQFERATVAARDGSDRVTIDVDVRLSRRGAGEKLLRPELAVMEAKSESGDSAADRALADLGVEPVSLSKYRVGIALLTDALPAGNPEPAAPFFD